MAAIPLPTDPSGCSCSDPSPTFTIRFEALSDEDLDALETFGWLYSSSPPPTVATTCEEVKTALSVIDCWRCSSERRRRELLIAKLFSVSVGLSALTASQLKQMLEFYERCLTPDERAAALGYARWDGVPTRVLL